MLSLLYFISQNDGPVHIHMQLQPELIISYCPMATYFCTCFLCNNHLSFQKLIYFNCSFCSNSFLLLEHYFLNRPLRTYMHLFWNKSFKCSFCTIFLLLFLRNKWFVFIFPIYFIPNNLFPCYITPLIVPWNKSFKFPKTNIFKCSFDTFFIFVPSQQMIFGHVPNIFCSNSCIPSQLYFLKCSLATYMHLFIGNISFKFF